VDTPFLQCPSGSGARWWLGHEILTTVATLDHTERKGRGIPRFRRGVEFWKIAANPDAAHTAQPGRVQALLGEDRGISRGLHIGVVKAPLCSLSLHICGMKSTLRGDELTCLTPWSGRGC
jgi:hypothetical protein